ncbi:flagellar hook-length control protein FliK [Paludibacterium purpuratum]|uniref:Flagellar hook-length control protein FliK n=1 Tax=Paludibacterium purpuratum TaxID=1144873 RepID=A0A4R7BFT5_9NEIS|nr:flagellar hook-length control protein FliK [Paludibacterium purpuratum]TDR82935.1 flagellar hook-length control protein FliK [Paludibacterium purpuratum]
MPIALSVSPAASALAANSSSPAAAFSAQTPPAQGSGSGKDATGNATPSTDQSGQAAQTGQNVQSAQNTQNTQANQGQPQNGQDVFARMLDAQLGALDGSQGTIAGANPSSQDGDKSAKPAKHGDTDASAVPVNPLPNPALLLIQPQVPPTPVPPTTAGDSAAQDAKRTVADPLSAAESATLLAQNGAASMGDKAGQTSADSLGNLFQPLSAGKDDALQKLPQDAASQPTNLPQSLAMQAHAVPQDTPTTKPTFNIPQQVGTPAWTKSLGDQVMGMVTLKAETAHIQLNPPELGPIDVTLKMDGRNNAQVTFNADSAATRAALQDSLPRLHSMMSASGIQLGDAQVSGGQSQQQQQNARNGRGNGQNQPSEGEEFDTLANIKASRGVLSIFA